MATGTSLSHAFPLGSRLNERGRLEVGGCDTIELAREFGTPAYVVAEDDLRARARAFLAGRPRGRPRGLPRRVRLQGVSLHRRAAPVRRRRGCGATWPPAASCTWRSNAGFAPERIVLHGNAKSEAELRMALQRGVGLIVIDNFDEIERLERLRRRGRARRPRRAAGARARHPRRARRDPREDLHRPGRLEVRLRDGGGARGDRARARRRRLCAARACTRTSARSCSSSSRSAARPPQLAALGEFPVWDLGGGLGVQYTAAAARAAEIEEYVGGDRAAPRTRHGIGPQARLLIEPGRALCANAARDALHGGGVKQNVSRWVAVDGGMSDNLRPMLYGAAYEAHVADRFGGATECVLAGKHCESGDVIVRAALLDDPRPGDVIVTPATGAYGYAMANNYNGVPRPPVIFCRTATRAWWSGARASRT